MRFPTMCQLTCVDLDEPVQPPFKLRNSKWCSYAQADLRLLLAAHTTLLQISCTGLIMVKLV